MSSSTIIELRQLDSSDVSQNGVFTTILDPNSAVMLEEGDQVNVKAIYLDTAESSAGFIHLENDVECRLDVAMYIQNYEHDQTFANAAGNSVNLRQYPNVGGTPEDPTGGRTVENRGDNQIWWLASHSNNTATTNWTVDSIALATYVGGAKDVEKIDITYSATPITPNAKPTQFTIPLKSVEKGRVPPIVGLGWKITGTASAPIIKRITTDAAIAAAGYVLAELSFTALAPGLEHFTLQTFPCEFIVPAGDYTPAEISKTITDKIANIEKNGFVNDQYNASSASNPPTKTQWVSNSPFLTSILENLQQLNEQDASLGQAFVNATNYTTDAGVNEAGTLYMDYNIPSMINEYNPGSGTPITGYLPPVDRFVGANEVAMTFDLNENKLKWETIHFPIYANGTDNGTAEDAVPSVIYNPALTSGKFVVKTGLATRYAGIAFTSMTPTNFFGKQLGFSNMVISPRYTAQLRYPLSTSALPPNPNSFTIDALDGINITGAYPGLDIGVSHNNVNYSRPIFNNLNAGNGINNKIGTTASTSIFSQRVWNSSLADEGYFLVEVSPNFKQNLVGGVGQKSKNTMSIVNRYYTQNSFTSDQGAGSISYTHTGNPELLSNISVAVRNPDRSFVNSNILQPKNTIFIEVIKAIGEDSTLPPVKPITKQG